LFWTVWIVFKGPFDMTKENAWCGPRASLTAFLALLIFGCGGSSSNNPTPQTSSEFLYSASVNGITAFPIDALTGALGSGTQAASSFTSIGVLANIISDPAGKFLFVCSLGDSSIEGFSINASSGALTPLSGSPFPIQGSGFGNLSMDPSGRFLYAPSTSGITAYILDQTTGTLSAMAGSPFSDGSTLRASVVDPAGKFLYASGNTTQITTSVFTIDSTTGALTPITGSPFQSPINSELFSLAVHPSGKFLYGSFPAVSDIVAWSIDPSTGALTVTAGSPFVTGNGTPILLVVPSGNFLYALNGSDNTVSGFSIDANSGALAAVNGGPFPVSAGTGYLAMDPLGQFLYAANGATDTITGFNINASTGAIAAFSTSPVPAADPTLLAVIKTSH
jgi:6-phosphogluconolactonase